MTFRRVIASLCIVVGCVLLMAALLFAVAQSSRVQTAAVGAVLRQVQTSLHTRAEVEKVDYTFPNRLLVRGILLEDQLGDTLLYADTLRARFDLLALLRDDKVAFRRVDLAHVRLYAHPVFCETDSLRLDSVMNYRFLIDAFHRDNRREGPFPIRLEVKNVSIRDARLQYADWLLHLDDSALGLNHLSADSLDAEVDNLALTVRRCDRFVAGGGPLDPQTETFCLNDFHGRVILTPQYLSLPEVYVALSSTRFRATEMLLQRGDSTFLQPSSAVSFHIQQAHLHPADLALFVPSLRSFRGYIDAHGLLLGRVDSLHAADLSLAYNGQRILLGDVTADGLPDIHATDWRVECRDLFVNSALLQDFVSNLMGKPFRMPAPVARLGDMHYRGSLAGQIRDLALHGVFTSALGNITTNGRASIDTTYSLLTFTGDIATRRFALGRMLDNSQLGKASLSVHVDGRMADDAPFSGSVRAKVDQLRFHDYDYRDLTLDGTFRNKVFDGIIRSDDPNLNLAFNGRVDLSRALPAYDCTLLCHHLRLGQLHLSEKYADSDLSFALRLRAAGRSIDDFAGSLTVDTLSFWHANRQARMDRLLLTVAHDEPGSAPDAIRLRSDYADATFTGSYRLSTLANTVRRFIAHYLPQAFSASTRRQLLALRTDNHAEFSVYFRDLAHLFSVLELPVLPDQTPLIKGYVHESDNLLSLQAVVPDLRTDGLHFEDITLRFDNADDRLNLALAAFQHHANTVAAEHLGDLQYVLSSFAVDDSLALDFRWTNIDSIHNAGALRLTTTFRQYAGHPLIAAHIYPTDIILGDSLWRMDESLITYGMADTALLVNDFSLHSASQFIRANGVASTHPSDSIRVELQSIDLDYLLGALTDVHNAISFGGTATGWATAYGIFRHPIFEADLTMLNAKINGSLVGDLYARATLDQRKHVIIDGECLETFGDSTDTVRRKVAGLQGDIGGPDHAWQLHVFPDSVRAGFLSFWLRSFATDIDGRASGDVHIYAHRPPKHRAAIVRVLVNAKGHDLGMTIPYTGARYYMSDSVILEDRRIRIPRLTMHDEDGNPLTVEAEVRHDGMFDDLTYHVDIFSDKAIVLNLPETPDRLYSGKIYATGSVGIDGDRFGCRIDAAARTDVGSTVAIMTKSPSSASSSDFIHFVNHTPGPSTMNHEPLTINPQPGSAELSRPLREGQGGSFNLQLNLLIDATPDILARVVIDPRTGDQLRGRGEGNLRLSYSTSDGCTMFGGYTLQQGTFSFTFQNVLRREFEIASGSTVTWQGDPIAPVLDARAIYHVTASLRDLFGSDASQISTNRSSVPVNCVLNLSGVLTNPVIRFGINLPSSDESVASQVRSIINTEDMVTRQVLYLLVFNRFYTPEYLQDSRRVGVNETFSILSSTVTGQINNWLGKITNAFTLGFNIRTDGEGAAASQEYEAQFEIQPLRGLLINGNFGYRYNDISNQPIFGNLDIEYMLTRDGKLRAKAYTHTVDKYSLRTANTVQGVGLVFKHDFNWPTRQPKDSLSPQPSALSPHPDSTSRVSLSTGDTILSPPPLTSHAP
ncbi:MAG: translocation/assembly module TamB domain-containing protein [Paludibacteraceae bacterium]|nr:translocation/assembly module TamB domain-containing protein [Paludibacteraceae bacterium]